MSGQPPRIVVLFSGRGSNLQAILNETRAGRLPIVLAAAICNRAEAPGLTVARAAGLPTEVIAHGNYATRDAFDTALMQAIDRHTPDLVVLAGFMRVLGPTFIRHYHGRLINIHPSLLPAYKGLNTHARALADGAHEHGCTVHAVSEQVDGGAIIAQARVPILPGDSPETLAARVLEQEHRLYPEVIRGIVENMTPTHGQTGRTA